MSSIIRKVLLLALAAGYLFFDPAPRNSGDEVFLYRYVNAVAPTHFPLNQGPYGSCVAFGHAAGCDTLLAEDKLNFRATKWLASSPDSIYGGSRNEAYGRMSRSNAQGSNGYGATRWLTVRGGVLYRQPYQVTWSSGVRETIDLTSYSIPRTADWGYYGNGGERDGINGPLDRMAQKTPVKGASLVRTLEELDVALKNGRPVTVCSSQGFTKTRDRDGFCSAQGSWSHCMCILGKRNEGRKGYLILNSWGNYVSGPKYKDQPDGSFYAEPAVVARMLRANDSYALSCQTGFPRVWLPNWITDPDADVREQRVSIGDDGLWQFLEDDGRVLKFYNGQWLDASLVPVHKRSQPTQARPTRWKCEGGVCTPVAVTEVELYATAA